MNILLFPFMTLADIGLVLSLIAHCMALMGLQIPGGQLVWSLHVGIFVVWAPAVLVSMQTTRYATRKDFWKVALAGCPAWMTRTFYILFGYAILNFILFAFVTGHGKHIAGDATPEDVRGFSGHWMVFYGAAFAILYSRIHAPQLFREQKCPNGHTADPTAIFCQECGYKFSTSQKDSAP